MENLQHLLQGISLEISNPCNEHCLHCYRHCLNKKSGFLTKEQASTVLSQAKILGAKNVTVTGGESLLNPDWKDILNISNEMGFRLFFYTNGILLNEMNAEFLASAKNLVEIQISLYAMDENIHDSITGVKGSCSKTKNAINLLRERNIPLFISCPVMKENKTAVFDVMRWCDDNNIKSCADIFIFGESDYTGNNLKHRLSLEDLQDFFDETMKANARLSYVWGKGYGNQNLSEIEFYGEAGHSLLVSGDGTVYPAIGWYEPLGNIATDSLKGIFENHPLLKELRTIHASDIAECKNCKYSDFCDFCFSPHITANNGELRKLDKDYCKFVKIRKEFAFVRDLINYLQSVIGKSVVKTEKTNIYSIEDIGEFKIETNTNDFNYSICSSKNSNNGFSFEVDEVETDVVTITPVDKTTLKRNSTYVIVRKSDSNNFIFYGSDGKKIAEEKLFAELENNYNEYNNALKKLKNK